MKRIALAGLVALIANAAMAFETGTFECLNGKLADANAKPVSTFKISKITMKSDAGEVVLPYLDYSFNDETGNRSNIKGIAQISSNTWTDTMEKQVIQLDSHNIRIVFGGNSIQTFSGECRKLK